MHWSHLVMFSMFVCWLKKLGNVYQSHGCSSEASQVVRYLVRIVIRISSQRYLVTQTPEVGSDPWIPSSQVDFSLGFVLGGESTVQTRTALSWSVQLLWVSLRELQTVSQRGRVVVF